MVNRRTNRTYSPAVRLKSKPNGPLRSVNNYQFGFYDIGVLRDLYMNHLSLLTQMNIITILIFVVICKTFLQHLRCTMLAFFAILVS